MNGFVDGGRSVLANPPIEQSNDPVGVPAPVSDGFAGKMIQAVHDPGIGRPVLPGSPNGRCQFGTESLIGIEDQDVIVCRLIDGKLFLITEAQEGLLDDPGTKGFGDRHSPICRSGVDDQDLLDDVLRTGQAISEVLFGIQGDDDQGKRRHTANLRWGGGIGLFRY